MSYSKPRLEGRALEHCLAKDSGHGIRMKSASGNWENVLSAEARDIRKFMKGRVQELFKQLEDCSLFSGGADMPCEEPACGTRSVDLLLKTSSLSELGANIQIITEVKWTRQSIRIAMNLTMLGLSVFAFLFAFALLRVQFTETVNSTAAQLRNQACKSQGWLTCMCNSGKWVKSRHALLATHFGFLVVTPSGWELQIRKAADASFRTCYVFPPRSQPPPMRVLAMKKVARRIGSLGERVLLLGTSQSGQVGILKAMLSVVGEAETIHLLVYFRGNFIYHIKKWAGGTLITLSSFN